MNDPPGNYETRVIESFPLPACSRIFLEHRYSVADVIWSYSGVARSAATQLILASRISSEWPIPYTAAVSIQLTPSSSAR